MKASRARLQDVRSEPRVITEGPTAFTSDHTDVMAGTLRRGRLPRRWLSVTMVTPALSVTSTSSAIWQWRQVCVAVWMSGCIFWVVSLGSRLSESHRGDVGRGSPATVGVNPGVWLLWSHYLPGNYWDWHDWHITPPFRPSQPLTHRQQPPVGDNNMTYNEKIEKDTSLHIGSCTEWQCRNSMHLSGSFGDKYVYSVCITHFFLLLVFHCVTLQGVETSSPISQMGPGHHRWRTDGQSPQLGSSVLRYPLKMLLRTSFDQRQGIPKPVNDYTEY